ncbi:MAG: protein kinase domain-containing protein [Acidobacteriota bacterium]
MADLPSKIGPYPVEGELGRGGMGIVYLARDPRLERHVAIKALDDEVAADPERRARFEREARLLAALSHPNVAGIYGIEEHDGRICLVLEYVEGPTLSQRLEEGPLPIPEAIDVALQVAAGVAAAHEAGIVHRDLKPANVKLTPQGQVKVLDFGLAKSYAPEPTSGSDPSRSPTVAYDATRAGLVLGTAGYMSPEQARGRPLDRRTDLWAFGCILFEMLTGKQAFKGETISDTLAAVLRGDPEWEALPEQTPAALKRLLRRCLEKDPRRRLRDASDARIELEEALAEPPGTPVSGMTAAALAGKRWLSPRAAAGAAALLLTGAALGSAALFVLLERRSAKAAAVPVTSLSLEFPEDLRVGFSDGSPDGRALFMLASKREPGGGDGPRAMIYRRDLESYKVRALPGTEGARAFAVSRDGKWIYAALYASGDGAVGRLARLPADGSAPPVVFGTWEEGWRQVVALPGGDLLVLNQQGNEMARISSRDGRARKVALRMEGFRGFVQALRPLPREDRAFANLVVYAENGFRTDVGIVDLATGEMKALLEDGGNPRYLPETGQLLFSRRETLLAVPFDPVALTVTGTPVALLDGMRTEATWTPAAFFVGADGTLFYVSGGRAGTRRGLVLLDEAGHATPWSAERRSLQGALAISPDGETLAVTVTNAENIDETFLADRTRRSLRRFMAIPGADVDVPIFTPDGKSLVFARTARTDEDGLYAAPLDGSRPPVRLWKTSGPAGETLPLAWTPEGDLLIGDTSKTRIRIRRLLLKGRWTGEAQAEDFTAGRGRLGVPAFSPDGRWVAYPSDESGQYEVYVAPYRDGRVGSPAVSVSHGQGYRPLWSADGKTLYFVAGDGTLKKARAGASPGVFLDPEPLFSPNDLGVLGALTSLRVWPQGGFLAAVRGEEEGEIRSLRVVSNWTRELRQRTQAAGVSEPR